MTSQTFFFLFIPILGTILLAINLILAPHNPYEEKDSAFECGFHSFLGQNRSEFSISFFIFALLFLLFDLEILLVYPYVVSGYVNGVFGLIILLIFFLILTLGFAFELGKNALTIESRQVNGRPFVFQTMCTDSNSVGRIFYDRRLLSLEIILSLND
ncbi:NADH dehydrogenase subunit 3 [Handroanthus impetiginosus]|uniref:NADH-ubiquinone oxidoreductase chain 3 n=1 Tax=Handroanthus impetiginosus TaxID=429701 RepID=A0A2G9FWG0_9LAMI|nr:NADH dehydrogenase subunit 3 [Handroanthus impetiginosus]